LPTSVSQKFSLFSSFFNLLFFIFFLPSHFSHFPLIFAKSVTIRFPFQTYSTTLRWCPCYNFFFLLCRFCDISPCHSFHSTPPWGYPFDQHSHLSIRDLCSLVRASRRRGLRGVHVCYRIPQFLMIQPDGVHCKRNPWHKGMKEELSPSYVNSPFNQPS